MVKETIKNNKAYYVCEVCGMVYRKYQNAYNCEIGCKSKRKCYTRMIKKSVGF